LIDLLWDSLDDNRIQQTEAKWAAESEDRIDAFERGELPAVGGPSALEELRSSIREMKELGLLCFGGVTIRLVDNIWTY
jgi:hypothetical protein